MGLNISGLVINKNYSKNIAQLEPILSQKLVFENEVSLSDACESWKGDEYCDIYFSENGTLIFSSMELGGFEIIAGKQDTLSFVLSESSPSPGLRKLTKCLKVGLPALVLTQYWKRSPAQEIIMYACV